MKHAKPTFVKIVLVLLALASLGIIIFRAYRLFHYAKTGEDFSLSFYERIFGSPKEEANKETEESTVVPEKLTVNPEFNGTNSEFIYSTANDDEAITGYKQIISYQYYDDKGGSIAIVNTWLFDANGDTVSTNYWRERCKMSDSTVLKQEINIVYRYTEYEIYRDFELKTYTVEGSLTTTTDSTTKPRAREESRALTICK